MAESRVETRSTLLLVQLRDVIRGARSADAGLEITNLAYATDQVTPGTLFFCVRGFTRDGHDFAPEAIAKGAVALVVDHPLNLGVPEVLVDNVRAAMAPAAANFYNDPTKDLQVVGVTGTNGKTTTAFLVRDLLEADTRQTGLLGTVKSIIGGETHEVVRTTPEAIDLQRTFRQMREQGDVAAVMEVSSHALELHRADAIHFAAAIFTNLTQDHLDFHPTMEDYFHAKRKLFVELNPQHSIINIDDPYGNRLAQELGTRRHHVRARQPHRDLPRHEHRHDPHRLDVHGQDAGRTDRSQIPAQRPVQRLQRPRRIRRRAGTRRAPRNRGTGDHNSRQGPGPLRGGGRGPGLRRDRRLRPHPGQPGERPPCRAWAHRQARHRRLWRRG